MEATHPARGFVLAMMTDDFTTESPTRPEAHKTLAEVAAEWRAAMDACDRECIAITDRPTKPIRMPRL
jgi:hypothetical protein